MFRFSGFTQKANNAINVAMREAAAMGHTYIGSEHLILGLLDTGSGVAHVALTQKSITFDAFRKAIVTTVGSGDKTALTPEDFTPRCKKVLEMSIVKARMMGHSYVGTEHILMVVSGEKDSYGVKLLSEMGADPDALTEALTDAISPELREGLGERPRRTAVKTPPRQQYVSTRTPTLDKYSRDLTDLALQNRLDPLFCREKEIARLVQILCRRTKNNPCLIGEAGVGKTAIVEGLAQRMVCGAVPEMLRGKRLLSLDLTSMVAGAKYRGDFEERIKSAMEEVMSSQDIVLFIDELHTIMGAGAAEGAIDAANILKPQLARGDLQLIGATTLAEYRKHIEKDAALERRFQSVMVEEPSEENSVEILRGLRGRYEEHHRVEITDEALLAAVSLSARYIADRFLPDKAIDLVDEAASRVRLGLSGAPHDLLEVEDRLAELQTEKVTAIDTQDFELAASIRDREKNLRGRLVELRGTWSDGDEAPLTPASVTREDIALLVSEITGIDTTTLSQEQSEQLACLEDQLHRRVIGQAQAVNAVANAIRRSRVGLGDPQRPIGSFIFLGPTGVGKTELCLALAETLFSRKNSLIRLDMSEYMEKHTVAKLIGSPPGYVGYEDGGQLTERVRRSPYSVVLFDEIEKAHPDVFNILLQILEDGVLADSQGRTVSFQNTVVVMTSNAGARHITEHTALGFVGAMLSDEEQAAGMKKNVMGELRQLFRPEFLNRVDEIIVFSKLNKDETTEIARKMFEQLADRALRMGIGLEFTDSAVTRISQEGYDILYGARPLRRALQRKVEDALANKILCGDIRTGEKLVCDYCEDEFVFLKV